jgi:hypothetical protein
LVGRTLLLIWRKPFSQTARSFWPCSSSFGASSAMMISLATQPARTRSLMMQGISNTPNSGRTVDLIEDGLAANRRSIHHWSAGGDRGRPHKKCQAYAPSPRP